MRNGIAGERIQHGRGNELKSNTQRTSKETEKSNDHSIITLVPSLPVHGPMPFAG